MYCKAETRTYIFTLKLAAVDGMKCSTVPNEICVGGKCQVSQKSVVQVSGYMAVLMMVGYSKQRGDQLKVQLWH